MAALNALRGRYDYVITTGGIGPTHDDITADAVARAFGVPIGEDPRAIAIMLERYAPADLTPARRRMARMPEGSELIDNPISRAPGFRIGNVFVLAGVPSVMQAMLDSAVKDDADRRGHAGRLDRGRRRPGGTLRRRARPGSPRPIRPCRSAPTRRSRTGGSCNQIVVRGKEAAAVQAARAAVEAMLASIRGDGKPL